ncbi:MAG TPA: hypothetical protein VFP08_13580 [Acidimicrobiales bacterium]|nr:hypothetical protein [Acidimicrobiales bacterium]
MVHLDDDTLLALLDLPSVTTCVDDAFRAWGSGQAATTQRVRATVENGAESGMASAMAAVVPPFCGGKVYATKDGVFSFINVLFDIDGRLLCTLDGDALTRLRTPAASALAIRHLAADGVEVAALVGAGRQAWYHLEMLRDELPTLASVRVHARRPEAAAALVHRAQEAGIPAFLAPTAAAAVDGAEVVVTATPATAPLFPASVVGDRALLCAVGSTKAGRCEIGPEVIERCVAVVADDVVGSMSECGDLIQAARQGRFDWVRAIELNAVVAGRVAVTRAGNGPVLFETQGVALQDVAAAGLGWRRHQEQHARHEQEEHA